MYREPEICSCGARPGAMITEILPAPRPKQKVMTDIKVVQVENDEWNCVKPRESTRQPIRDRRDHAPGRHHRPEPTQKTHVTVLVALVCLLVPRRGPQQLDPEQPVLDRCQVGIRLDHHNMLHVEAVPGLGPIAEDDGAVYNRGDSKCQVVVLEPLRPQYKQKSTRDGGDEDPERHGGVVQQS